MMFIFWLILLGTIALLIHQLWYKRKDLPNGPMPIFFIGNIFSFWKYERWEDKFLEWKSQFGPIYTYWLGPVPIVTVNDYKIAIEMFVKDGDTYVDKYVASNLNFKLRGGIFGVIDTSGDEWRTQRRLALRILRDLGLGKNRMQEMILEEIQTIFETLNKELEGNEDEELDFQRHTNLAVGSIINNVICGYRFSANGREHEYYKMKEIINRLINLKPNPLIIIGALLDHYNIKVPFMQRYQQQFIDEFQEIFLFVDRAADEHLKNTDYSTLDEPRDFIDAYIMAGIQSEQETGKNLYYTRDHLRNTGADVWFGGMESVSSTITWAIAYLIVYSDAQQKLQDEFDKVIGSDRMITASDRPNLPYMCAVIMEVQRCANIVSQNLLRTTIREVEIQGKLIPKGTICTAQLSTIHIDPNIFPNPKRFNPSRFIDENGHFKPAKEVIPFSLGKRACMGESVAKMELFLILSNLFNHYKFYAGTVPPTLLKNKNGASFDTKPFNCRLQKRFPN